MKNYTESRFEAEGFLSELQPLEVGTVAGSHRALPMLSRLGSSGSSTDTRSTKAKNSLTDWSPASRS